MPTLHPPKLKPAQIRDAFKQDLSDAWAYSRTKHPDHTPYAFVLYGIEGGPIPHLGPHVLTEESLTLVAKRHLEQGHEETLDDARKALRYSIPDSPHFAELDDRVPSVDALMETHVETIDEDVGYVLLAKAAMQALADLDAQGLFGEGMDRERLLLTIITDCEKDWTTLSAKRLNPKATYKRFHESTKTDGPYASCDALTVSLDGYSLYSAGSREDPLCKGSSCSDRSHREIVAYDLRENHLVQRWAFSFPGFGDSGRAVACTPDDSKVLVLRCRYRDCECPTLLMYFDCNKDEPIQQQRLQGAPTSFALSCDGSRIAVATLDDRLHLLDANLNLLDSINLKARAHSVRFLKSSILLLATDNGVISLDPVANATTVTAPSPARHFATDDAEQLLAVSQWFALSGPERDHPVEFGVQLHRLPSFELVRSVLIPGHRAVKATLSHDGRLLAFEADEIGKHRKFIAVFDTESGREVARRRSVITHDFVFLRDNRTLAIGGPAFTKFAPIILWPIPNL